MEIRPLSSVSLSDLTYTFNEAFSDYVLKMNLSEVQMLHKIKSDNIQLSLSQGAFLNEKLLGFVLIGIDPHNFKGTAYNAGTGVIPGFRGQRISEQIYLKTISDLNEKGINKHQLEVITGNEKALKVYKKLGFTIERELGCYKGIPKGNPVRSFNVSTISSVKSEFISGSLNSSPAWQNSTGAIERTMGNITTSGVMVDDSLIAYCIFNKDSGRIFQITVKPEYRRTGIGSALLLNAWEKTDGKELLLLNNDLSHVETTMFLNALGFQQYVKQYEMTLLYQPKVFN